MAAHNELGKAGEQAAVDYLQQQGYIIRHRDWHFGHRDLDIVAQQGSLLVFVEVKTRRNTRFGEPVDFVSETKIRRIVQSADAYLRYFKLDNPIRFDVLSVVPENGTFHIHHIQDAFVSPVW